MSLLYQDNFQSYAVGTPPPYGGLVFYSGSANANIVADSAGLFGQTKSMNLPSTIELAFPTPDYTGLINPFYQQATVFQYVKLIPVTDEQGLILVFGNCHTNIFGGTFNNQLSGIRILTDGTLAIVADLTGGAFSSNTKVSDYSLLCGKWYLIRTDVTFGSSLGGNLILLSCTVYVNGIAVVTSSNTTTTIALSNFDHLYFNIVNFFGAGNTLQYGGLSIYDTVQASNFFPNPTTPSARLNQGVIELIKRRTLPLGNTRIYEA